MLSALLEVILRVIFEFIFAPIFNLFCVIDEGEKKQWKRQRDKLPPKEQCVGKLFSIGYNLFYIIILLWGLLSLSQQIFLEAWLPATLTMLGFGLISELALIVLPRVIKLENKIQRIIQLNTGFRQRCLIIIRLLPLINLTAFIIFIASSSQT